nr:hypothetical protein [Plantactinospora sp. KBS50]
MNRDDQLTRVLGAGIESFDIPEDQFRVAKTAYKAACDFLSTYWSASGTGEAPYPQGSMRLGTVTALIHRRDEYDLDMVCRHDLDRSQIDPEGLKADVGDALEEFVKERPDLKLTLDDGPSSTTCCRFIWTFCPPYPMQTLIRTAFGRPTPKAPAGIPQPPRTTPTGSSVSSTTSGCESDTPDPVDGAGFDEDSGAGAEQVGA